MNQRGFALVAVLWLVAALAVLASGALALARTGLAASGNRILLARAGWAREACIEILQARGFAPSRPGEPPRVARTPARVNLGRGAWCSLEVADPSGRLNLNLAGDDQVRALLADDSLADAFLDWRDPDDEPRSRGAEATWYRKQRRFPPRNGPVVSLEELQLVRGFDSATVSRLGKLFTVRGTGRLNINRAPPEVLQAVLGLPEGILRLLHGRITGGAPVESVDHLVSLVPPEYRALVMARYEDLAQRLVFGPPELLVTVTAGVGNSPLRTRATLVVVPLPGRVALVGREVE